MQNEQATSTVLLNGEQAKQELDALELKAKGLRKSIREASDIGDLAGVKRYNKELKETQQQMRTVKSEAFNAKKVLDDLSGSSLKDLYAAQKKIDSLLRNGSVKRNSEEWKELVKSQRKVKEEIQSINRETSIGENKWGRFTNKINQSFVTISAGIAAVTGISLALRKSAEDAAKMSDVYAQVMKYTGESAQGVEELNEALKKMDTRTSREELNLLLGEAGKLGVSGKEDLLGFAKAADIIKVALGADLGEGAAKSIGKLAKMFGVEDEMGLEKSMLAVGSAINEVAQNSTASEPYLLAFTNRVSGIGNAAGMTIPQIIGFASVLDQNAQNVEMSATALNKFISKLATSSEDVANAIGLPAEQLKKAVGEDMNSALMMVFEQLNKKGGLIDLAPLFKDLGTEGARAGSVITILASKFNDLTTEQQIANQSFREATSVVKEFGIQNTTMQARLDKAKKDFFDASETLGKSLSPAFLKSTNAAVYLIKALSELPKFLKENGQWLAAIAISLAAYTVASKASVIATQASILWTKLQTAWTNKAATAQAILNFVISKNPIAFVITLIAGLVAAFISWYNSSIKVQAVTQGLFAGIKVMGEKLLAYWTGLWKLISGAATLNPAKLKESIASFKKAFSGWGDDVAKAYTDAYNKRMEQSLKNTIPLKTKTKTKNETTTLTDTNEQIFTPDTTSVDKKSPYKRNLDELEHFWKLQIAANKKYFSEGAKTEEFYELQAYENKKYFLNEKLKLQKKYGLDTVDTEIELSDLQIAENKRLEAANKKSNKEKAKDNKDSKKEEEDAIKALAEFKERYAIDELGTFRSQKETELAILKEYLDQGLLNEKQAAKVRQLLKAKEFEVATKDFKETANAIADISSMASSAFKGFQDAELQKVETRYQKQIDAARKAGQDTTALEEQKNAEMAAIRAEEADGIFAMQAAMIIASTAVSAMDAYSSALKIPVGGLVLAPIAAGAAVLYGAAQLAQANAAREAAKEGYWTGGFTPPGDKYAPRGIVHAGEFVGNQEATNHAPIRKIFNLVDHAQRTNTVARITNEDIMRTLNAPKGYSNGGYVQPTAYAPQPVNTDMSAILNALDKTNAVNAALLQQIERGIYAKVSIHGDNGISEQTEKYNAIKQNAQR